MRWQKITIVGAGLLGGSLGLAIKRHGLASCVSAYVRRTASIQECLDRGVADEVGADLRKSVKGAELVVLCTPTGRMRALLDELAPELEPGTLVTDVGSIKESLVRELEPVAQSVGAHFIGSHPMAGSEKTGVTAAREDLFKDAICVLTPTEDAQAEALTALRALWQGIGAQLMELTPSEHDRLVSRASHLPHLVASALAKGILDPQASAEQWRLCGHGFRDTTRIALGSPSMWKDILLGNRTNLLAALDEFLQELEAVRDDLASGDSDRIQAFLEAAQARRHEWLDRQGEAPPNQGNPAGTESGHPGH